MSKKLNDTHNELTDIKQKVQDTNSEVNKLKSILKSEVCIYLFLLCS